MKAADFKPPARPSEQFTLPDGSEITVRALSLTQRLVVRRQVTALTDGKSAEEAIEFMVPRLLAIAVVDEDGKPLMTAEQWEDYGSVNPTAALQLFNKASELSGFSSEGAEKNS